MLPNARAAARRVISSTERRSTSSSSTRFGVAIAVFTSVAVLRLAMHSVAARRMMVMRGSCCAALRARANDRLEREVAGWTKNEWTDVRGIFINQCTQTKCHTTMERNAQPRTNIRRQDRELLGSLLFFFFFFFFFSPCQDHDGLHRRSLPILLKHR